MKNRIKSRVVKNFLSLTILKGVGMLLPIILIPYLIGTVGIELVGLLALVSTIGVYFHTVIDYGFAYTAIRDIARDKMNKSNNTQVFYDVFYCKLLLSLGCIILLYILSFFVSFINNNLTLIFIHICYVITLAMSPSWFFQAIEDMYFITIAELFGKILSFLLIIWYVALPEDIYLVPLSYFIGQFFCLIFYIFFIKKYIYFYKWKCASIKSIQERIVSGWGMFIYILFPNMYNSYSYLILGTLSNLTIVAIYDIARRIFNVSEQLLIILSKVYYPILSRDFLRFKEFLRVMIVFSVVLSILNFSMAYFFSDYLFNEENVAYARIILYIQSIAPIFFAAMLIFGINGLGVNKMDRLLRNNTIYSSIFGFFAVTYLTTYYSAIGAIVGVVLTWLLCAILCFKDMFYIKKER